MNYDQLLEILRTSMPDDWISASQFEPLPGTPDVRPPERAVYREDLALVLQWFAEQPGKETYQATWLLEVFGDDSAPLLFVQALYNGVPIVEYEGVRVDNRRCMFPVPMPDGKGHFIVSRDDEQFFGFLSRFECRNMAEGPDGSSFTNCLDRARDSQCFIFESNAYGQFDS